MPKKKKECLKPRDLKGKPEERSPEQIARCHGNAREHPCIKKGKKKKTS